MWLGGAVEPEDKLDRAATASLFRRTIGYMRPYKKMVRLAIALIFVWTLLSAAGPLLVRRGIDHGIVKGDVAALNVAVVLYGIAAALTYLVARRMHVAVNIAGESFLRDLRERVFAHLQRQSMTFFDREKAGVLVSFTILFFMSWQLSLIVVAIMPILAVASIRFQRTSNAAYLVVRDRVGQNLASLQEGVAGVRVIQAYGREDEQTRRFVTSNRALYDAHLHGVRVSTWYFVLVDFAGSVAIAAAVGYGGWLVHQGDVSLGTLSAFVLMLSAMFEPVQQLSQLYNTVQSAGASLNKLYGLLDHRPDIDEVTGAVDLTASGAVALRDVSFAYEPGRNVLADVELRIADGERLALVGPTGAGKSTLAKLVARLYDPTTGAVEVGGVDLRRATLRSLRERIVVVPQEGFLFSGSIRDNVRIARPSATDAEVDEAIRTIGAWERFAAFEDGVETEVRERGSRLSAGERQLVSLARAALVDPAVLVLDEATSNLDPGTEATVEHALELLMTGRTVVVVAHRLSTVRRADRIVVVDAGRIVEMGSHEELVARGGRYAALSAAWSAAQT